jgi:hypothetical protein
MSSALVAQGIEHGSPKAGVAGSNPAGGTSEAFFDGDQDPLTFIRRLWRGPGARQPSRSSPVWRG